MRFNFWKKEPEPIATTNEDIANDLLIQIRHKSPDNQREVLYYMMRKIAPEYHIHQNPQKKVARAAA